VSSAPLVAETWYTHTLSYPSPYPSEDWVRSEMCFAMVSLVTQLPGQADLEERERAWLRSCTAGVGATHLHVSWKGRKGLKRHGLEWAVQKWWHGKVQAAAGTWIAELLGPWPQEAAQHCAVGMICAGRSRLSWSICVYQVVFLDTLRLTGPRNVCVSWTGYSYISLSCFTTAVKHILIFKESQTIDFTAWIPKQ
jgi:hypothetical protein